MSVPTETVETRLRVGTIDMVLAQFVSDQHYIIEFPAVFLPEVTEPGSILKVQVTRDLEAEQKDRERFEEVQQEILDTFATNLPKPPVLRTRNITQTSVVLEWDPIEIASADLNFMALYKGEHRVGFIPQPLTRRTTKITNLEIDQPYNFQLVLSTTAGDFESETLNVKTHKMTDLTGVVVCLGSLVNSDISEDEINETLHRLGARSVQDTVRTETTHFICTTEGGQQYQRALEVNIPVVVPAWLKACEAERRLVSVRGYYLGADPAFAAQTRTHSAGAQQSSHQTGPATTVPQQQRLDADSEPAFGRGENPAESTDDVSPAEVPGDEVTADVEPAENNGTEDAGETLPESVAPVSSNELTGAEVNQEVATDAVSTHEHGVSDVENAPAGDVVESNGTVGDVDAGSGVESADRELEKELNADPLAKLKDGEEQHVTVEKADTPMAAQSADIEDAGDETKFGYSATDNEDPDQNNDTALDTVTADAVAPFSDAGASSTTVDSQHDIDESPADVAGRDSETQENQLNNTESEPQDSAAAVEESAGVEPQAIVEGDGADQQEEGELPKNEPENADREPSPSADKPKSKSNKKKNKKRNR